MQSWLNEHDQRLASGNGSEDDEGFAGGEDGFGEGCVGGEVGPVFFADEEAEEGAALLGDVVADGVAEHGVAGLEGVEDGGDGGGGGNVEGGLVGGEIGEAAEVDGKIDADGGHGPRGGIVQGLERAVALYARCPHLRIEIWGTRIRGAGSWECLGFYA